MNENVFKVGLNCHMPILVHSQRDFFPLDFFKRSFGIFFDCFSSLMLAHHHWSDNCENWIQSLKTKTGRNVIYVLSSF